MQLKRLLKLGCRGDDVVAVKMALRAWNRAAMSNTTSLYGPGAVAAVMRFQADKGLVKDGIVGQHTLDKLAPFFDAKARNLYERYQLAWTLVQPIPAKFSKGHSPVHPTAGLDGYPASDFFAAPGSPVVAPERALVARFSGHDPAQGPIGSGPPYHGPYGWSIYLTGVKSGTSYYLTHLANRVCVMGGHVERGEKIASVADYDRYGTPSHTHCGVHGGTVTIEKLIGASLA